MSKKINEAFPKAEPIVVNEPDLPVSPIDPNPRIVDKGEPKDYPIDDPDFLPLSPKQFEGSMAALVKKVPADKFHEVFKKFRKYLDSVLDSKTLEAVADNAESNQNSIPKTGTEKPQMNNKKTTVGKPVSESVIRMTESQLRKMVRDVLKLQEATEDALAEADDEDEDAGDGMGNDNFDDIMAASALRNPDGTVYRRRDGVSAHTPMAIDDIAKGYMNLTKQPDGSTLQTKVYANSAGARQAIEKAKVRLGALMSLEDTERHDLFAQAGADYLDFLISTGKIDNNQALELMELPGEWWENFAAGLVKVDRVLDSEGKKRLSRDLFRSKFVKRAINKMMWSKHKIKQFWHYPDGNPKNQKAAQVVDVGGNQDDGSDRYKFKRPGRTRFEDSTKGE